MCVCVCRCGCGCGFVCGFVCVCVCMRKCECRGVSGGVLNYVLCHSKSGDRRVPQSRKSSVAVDMAARQEDVR